MQIRYTNVPYRELEFRGNRDDFRKLANLLAQSAGELRAENGCELAPYPHFGSAVVIKLIGGEKLKVKVDHDVVVIEGDAPRFNLLASNVKSLAEAEPPYHTHIEHYPDHPYLAADSFPLVCCLT